MDFHTDRFRVVTLADLNEKRIEWLKTSHSKKDVDNELKRLSNLPTGKDADTAPGGGAGLGFGDEGLPVPEPSERDPALQSLARLEKEIGKDGCARKRPPKGELRARQQALAMETGLGSPGRRKKKKKSEKELGRKAKDRGPFGAGAEMGYGDGKRGSDSSLDESQLFREGLLSGGTSLQLQLQEYAQRRPGRLASRLLQKMRVMVAKKEGGPLTTINRGSSTPPVATTWVLTVMSPKQPPLRLLRKVRTLATALDEIAAGHYQYAADVLSQRIKALELFQSDGSWNRAQYLELLDAEGPSLLGRDDAVMVSKEWAGELRMRRLQIKGTGKADPKGGDKGGGKTEQPGGKDQKKGKHGKGKETAPPPVSEGPATAVGTDVKEGAARAEGEDPSLDNMLEDGFLDFDLGLSDDEGLPTGKDLNEFWAGIAKGLPMEEWRTKLKKGMDREPGMKGPLGIFARTYGNPEELPPGDGLEGITTINLHWVRLIFLLLDYVYCSAWSKAICVPMSSTMGANQAKAISRVASQVDRLRARPEKILSAKAAVAKLSSKKFDYNGHPVDRMKDLVVEKVLKAWPRPGSAAVVDLRDCLPEELREALDRPREFLLPEAELPDRHRGSRVRATETEWHKIVKAGYDRGMFVAVRDEDVPVDKGGHLITNGAGAVVKIKQEHGRAVEAQRFISVLCPTNDAMRLLPGAQDKLPYIGQLTALMAEKDSYLVLDSEDLQSAFNLFRMPLEWAPSSALRRR
ncbi:unnamed protein product [Symbiodinium sp. CCMP2456]|nr:unnamed protein product [Symbiodinium sp. CCMP2456]